jgi:Domain of unknown function (DUF4145)
MSPLVFRCGHCGSVVEHTVLFTHDFACRYVDAEGYAMSEPATYSGFGCTACSDISIYIHSALHNPTSTLGSPVFPERSEEFESLPRSVAEAYREAMKLKRISRPAFVLLGRRAVEIIAKDQGATAKSLDASLAQLVAAGRLPPLLAKASTMIRVFGNAAAHMDDAALNEHHVDMVDEFLRLIIQYLYVAPSSLRTFSYLLELEDDESLD